MAFVVESGENTKTSRRTRISTEGWGHKWPENTPLLHAYATYSCRDQLLALPL